MFVIQQDTYNKLVTGFMLVVFTLGLGTLVGLISKIIVPLLFVGAVGFAVYKYFQLTSRYTEQGV